MKSIMVKIGAYAVLSFGIALGLLVLLLAIILIASYPEVSLSKKAVLGASALIVVAIIVLVTISIFESTLHIITLEAEVEKLEDELEDEKEKGDK